MNTPWNALPPGTVLKGRYQVEEFLDQQPAAMVYRGIDLILGRTVALREFVPRVSVYARVSPERPVTGNPHRLFHLSGCLPG